MIIKLSFIPPEQFHYSQGVIDGAEDYPGELGYYGENWESGHFVRAEWGEDKFDFICRTEFWTKEEYEDDWRQELQAFEDKKEPAVLIVNFSDSQDETAAEMCRWYYLYHNGNNKCLYYGEAWATSWQSEFEEKITPDNIKKRYKENFDLLKERMHFETELQE